jgi:hypothetical protein
MCAPSVVRVLTQTLLADHPVNLDPASLAYFSECKAWALDIDSRIYLYSAFVRETDKLSFSGEDDGKFYCRPFSVP